MGHLSQGRQPPESPTGGQFAASTLTESELFLEPLPSPRNLEEVVLPGSPCWQGVNTHRHFIVPERAEAWFDIAYDGIDQLAQSTGSRWTITDAHGNADGIGLYVAERETETLFHAQASGTFTAAKIDEAAVSSMTMSLRDSTNRDLTARDLAANLRTVAASHRAMRALGNVLGASQAACGRDS